MGAQSMHISHFSAMLLFAALVSIALACLRRRSALGRIKYAAWTFVTFVLVGVAIAWLMYPFSH